MKASAEVSRKHRAGKKSTSSYHRKTCAIKFGSTDMGSTHSLESTASNAAIAAAASARATASARASQRVTAYLEMLATGPLPPPSGTGATAIPAKSTMEETKRNTTKEEKAWPQYLVPPVDLQKQPPSDAANAQEVNTKRSHLSPSLDLTRDRKPQGRMKLMDCTNMPWCNLIKPRGERPRTAPQQNFGAQRSRVSAPRLHTTSHATTRGSTLNKRGLRGATPQVIDRRPFPAQLLAQQAAQETLLQVIQNSARTNKILKKIQKSQGQASKQSGRISPVRDMQSRLSKTGTKTSVQRTTRPATRGMNVASSSKPKRVKYTTFSGK